jgi:Family of unknown function (DUF6527)
MKLSHSFVEYMPERLEEGVVYVSIRFKIASHLCCCGCGNEVVTPLSPTGWELTYDGVSVSLHPSIGNWGFPCRSHYWIRRDYAESAPNWSQASIRRAQRADAELRQGEDAAERPKDLVPVREQSLWSKLLKRFKTFLQSR